VLVTCWSAKGGSGVTTVAVALAKILAARGGDDALLVDLCGDLPLALGRPEPASFGVAEWLAAGRGAPADSLGRLELPAGRGLRLLPRGQGELRDADRAEVLAQVLASDARPVVVDAGALGGRRDDGGHGDVARVLAAAASRSLLVTRSCYLSLRRIESLPLRPSGVVLVAEEGRALQRRDFERALDVAVVAEVPAMLDIARRVDSGTLGERLPRQLERALRAAA
jgi:hypothetical protein